MPAAAKILAEKNIAASDVAGTGRDGRVTKADALGASAAPSKAVPARQQKLAALPSNVVRR
jgi:2-oxoglutarate dehydrogenase E2 component (dihydrolipoamide succinyltransferase)